MKFSCDQCSAQYMIADEKVGARGVKVKCKKCGNVIVVKPLAGDAAPEASAFTAPPATVAPGVDAAFGNMFSAPPAGVAAAAPAGIGTGIFPGAGTALSHAAPAAAAPAFAAAPAVSAPSAGAGAQLGGAFDSLFGGGGFGSMQAAVTPTAQAPSNDFSSLAGDADAAAQAALQKEWYVAIEDSQIGPIDLHEVEQRWDDMELTADSLAWKGGMADWLAIADIPELAYLITERPQQQGAGNFSLGPSIGSTMAPAGDLQVAKAPSTLGPVSFGGGDAHAVSWKPSAASALSSLVQEELVAKKKIEDQPVVAATPAGLPSGLSGPGFGAQDLFGGGNGGAQGGFGAGGFASGGGFGAGTPSFGGSAGGGFAMARSSSSGMKPLHWVLIGGGLAFVGLMAVIIVLLLRPAAPQGGPQLAALPAAPAAPAAPGAPGAEAAPAAPAPAAPAAAPAPAAPAPAAPKSPSVAAPAPAPAPAPSAPRESKPSKPKDDDEELFEKKPKPAAAPAVAKLSQADVVDGIKKNAVHVAPCLQRARQSGEIVPGSYKFILDWVIKPDGSVSGGQLKGPANVLGTSLPGCFAAAMRKWSFPASREGAPVRNFPFGPVNVR